MHYLTILKPQCDWQNPKFKLHNIHINMMIINQDDTHTKRETIYDYPMDMSLQLLLIH